MKKIITNDFQEYNDKGLYPELDTFGTGKLTGQPCYEFKFFIKGLDRSICLRRGAPSKGETRLIALQRLVDLIELVLQPKYETMIRERMFWEGFDYYQHQQNEKLNNPLFIAGQELKAEMKTQIDIHFSS